jgi:hypothetical protein
MQFFLERHPFQPLVLTSARTLSPLVLLAAVCSAFAPAPRRLPANLFLYLSTATTRAQNNKQPEHGVAHASVPCRCRQSVLCTICRADEATSLAVCIWPSVVAAVCGLCLWRTYSRACVSFRPLKVQNTALLPLDRWLVTCMRSIIIDITAPRVNVTYMYLCAFWFNERYFVRCLIQ